MRQITLIDRLSTILAALILIGSASYAFGDDRFALAPSEHDNLVVFGPKGDRVAELSVPTISQVVTVGATSFQISYGRDANNFITAILAPSSSQPQDLHFTVLNKTVDANKQAVVTLTFTDSKHVIIDPGYVGTVTVNSHSIRHHDLADSALAPSGPAPAPAPQMVPRVTADIQPMDIPPPAPATHTAPPAPSPVVKQTTPSVSHETVAIAPPRETPSAPATPPAPPDQSADPTGNNVPVTPPPQVGSLLSQPPIPVPGTGAGGSGAPKKKLFWAEPITPPNGTAPVVGIDQMKLTAVHGPVTLKLPDGEIKPGADGMLVPSGTSISTADGASAAIFMGGVDSARFLPDTQAKVSQNVDGSLRHTSINLKAGTIFSRVGHRPGEKQDYEVRTPEGVAAARGTSFSTTVTNSGGHEVTIVATQDGVVTLTDSSDGHKIIITPLKSGQVSIGSVPKLPSDILAQIFTAFLTDLQQFNTNMQAIANMSNPTAADLAYYNSNLGFDTNTQFYDTLSSTFVPLFPSGDNSEFIDQHNNINDIVPATRRALNQQLEPFGNVPLTPF